MTEKISEKIAVTLPLDYYRELFFLAKEEHLSPGTYAKVLICKGIDQIKKEKEGEK